MPALDEQPSRYGSGTQPQFSLPWCDRRARLGTEHATTRRRAGGGAAGEKEKLRSKPKQNDEDNDSDNWSNWHRIPSFFFGTITPRSREARTNLVTSAPGGANSFVCSVTSRWWGWMVRACWKPEVSQLQHLTGHGSRRVGEVLSVSLEGRLFRVPSRGARTRPHPPP